MAHLHLHFGGPVSYRGGVAEVHLEKVSFLSCINISTYPTVGVLFDSEGRVTYWKSTMGRGRGQSLQSKLFSFDCAKPDSVDHLCKLRDAGVQEMPC